MGFLIPDFFYASEIFVSSWMNLGVMFWFSSFLFFFLFVNILASVLCVCCLWQNQINLLFCYFIIIFSCLIICDLICRQTQVKNQRHLQSFNGLALMIIKCRFTMKEIRPHTTSITLPFCTHTFNRWATLHFSPSPTAISREGCVMQHCWERAMKI